MKQTAGTLLYRQTERGLEVLLVHASGNYNKKSPWSIPKGLPDPSEHFEEAARRETYEETGVKAGALKSLGHVDYKKTRKRIHCFAGPAPANARPRCASWEVDRSEFVLLTKAKEIIHRDQAPLLERLETELQGNGGATP